MYEKLIDKRKEKSITQDEMARLLGISTCNYNLKELGKLDFDLVEVKKILKILDDNYNNIFFNNNVTKKSYNNSILAKQKNIKSGGVK